jgi:uncharacterized protein Yka (UPF0111/DUF47 family)
VKISIGSRRQLDDVLNDIEAAAENVILFRIKEPLPLMIGLAETLAAATDLTAKSVSQLRQVKNKGNVVQNYIDEIDSLEDEGDRIFRRTKAYLYGGDLNAMDVLRYQASWNRSRRRSTLEDVADTVETITTKSA